ncbi:MAG: MFS transporter, partial [Pseudomonadota bacterium]
MNRSTGRFLATLRLLAVRRFAILAALGFVSGLPLLLTGGTLTYWFAREGIDKTTIGLFAIIAIPYTLKFLWAPLLDYLSPPPIIRKLGRRRGWAMSIVLPLAACLFAIGLCDPHSQLLLIALLGMMVAACSASLDIVLDALRIESLSDDEQAIGSALFIYGYRVAILVAGAGAFSLADYLAWSVIYSAMAGLMLVSSLIILMAFEPAIPQSKAKEEASLIYRICFAFLNPFIEFFQRLGLSAIAILALVILYKFGDAVLGQMANPFYHEMGYSGTEIGLVTKFWGLWATMIGIGAGGVLAIRIGLFHALVVAGIAQALTNLAFVWIAAGGDPLTAQLFQHVGGQEAGSGHKSPKTDEWQGVVRFFAIIS